MSDWVDINLKAAFANGSWSGASPDARYDVRVVVLLPYFAAFPSDKKAQF
jgi:hypothetical protein